MSTAKNKNCGNGDNQPCDNDVSLKDSYDGISSAFFLIVLCQKAKTFVDYNFEIGDE